jgi:kynurenine formamidase
VSAAAATNWGRWGAEDERGALNHLDPATVLAGLAAAREGVVYPLGLPVGRTGQPTLGYRGPAQRLTLTNHTDARMLEQFGATGDVGSTEDVLIVPSHNATHMDALGHVFGPDGTYNGFPAEGMSSYAGIPRCGIEHVGAVVTRGVLVDVAGHQGVDCLPDGHAITPDELRAAMEAQGVAPRRGDAVLVRTGWVERFQASGEGEPSLVQPGIGIDAARMLGELDVALVGADNTAVEAMPYPDGRFMGAHVELLVNRGIYLIEHLDLSALARDGRREFLFVTCPLRVTGASASPVNPVAVA